MEQKSILNSQFFQCILRFYASNKELVQRILTAVVGAPILIGSLLYGTPLSDVVFMAIGAAGLYEWSVMTGNSCKTLCCWWAGLCGVPFLCVYGIRILDDWGVLFYAFILFFVSFSFAVFVHQLIRTKRFAESLRVSFGVFLITHTVAFSSVWGYLESMNWLPLAPLFFVWIVDTGAYVVGRLVGGPKLCPRISPGKTWSGLVGGVLLATFSVLIVIYCLDKNKSLLTHEFTTFLIVSSILAGIIAQAGDLLESAAKRFYGVKDSGDFLPGHGGILDRFDGYSLVVLACPLYLLGGVFVSMIKLSYLQ